MSITSEQKQTLINKFQRNSNDTGSTHVQVAVLTERIKYLTEHFKVHKKDHHSRRGLLIMVARRRRLLQYLKRSDLQGYSTLIKDLGLRK